MTSPWGIGAWGTGGWGFSPLSLSSPPVVYATTTNDITVVLTTAMLQRSPVITGDATNPSTWQIKRLDTGTIVRIASIAVVSPTQITLHTELQLPPQTTELELTAASLLDSTGLPLSIGAPTFFGVTEAALATPQAIATIQTQGPRDLKNYTTPNSNAVSGTLLVKGGDYVNESGPSLQRKLIMRRLIARKGDFYHLPNYGAGVRVKQPLPAGNLVLAQTEIKQQVQQEPGLESVSVKLTQSINTLFVVVNAEDDKTGQQISVSAPFQIGGS